MKDPVRQQANIAVAERLLAMMKAGDEPHDIALLFSRTLRFQIQGDDDVLPWIGHSTGREAAAWFIRNLRALTEPVSFRVEDVLASEERAVIVGDLAYRLKENGRVFRSQFAIILTVSEGRIIRFQLLEDSFGLSRAVKET